MSFAAGDSAIRSFQLDGFPAVEQVNAKAGEYFLSVMVANRFAVTIVGNGIEAALGRDVWKQIDRKKLAGLAK